MQDRILARTERLLKMKELLRTRAWSIKELAEHFGTSRRTIERDLKALAKIGDTPIRVARGRYRLQATSSSLNPVEALAVHAATRLLYHQTPAPNRHYVHALDKLAAMLPEPARTLTQESIRPLRQAGDDRPLELVAQAWFNQNYLAFDYQAAGSKNWHKNELAVYFVEVNRQNLSLYAIGYERSYHRAIRTFKLTRMRNPRLLNDTYEIPSDFSPRAFLKHAWGLVGGERSVRVRLKFSPEAAPRVLEHPGPRGRTNPPRRLAGGWPRGGRGSRWLPHRNPALGAKLGAQGRGIGARKFEKTLARRSPRAGQEDHDVRCRNRRETLRGWIH